MGVWDTRIDPTLNDRLQEITEKDRKNQCFFVEVHDGMSFPAAIELERRWRRSEDEMGLSGFGPEGVPPKSNRVNEFFRRHGYTLTAIAAVAAVLALLLQ